MKEEKEKVCQETLRTQLRQENRHGCWHGWPWGGLFHLKLGSQTCGMFQSWRLVRQTEEGEGEWEPAIDVSAVLGCGAQAVNGDVGLGLSLGVRWWRVIRVPFMSSTWHVPHPAGGDTVQVVSFVLWPRGDHPSDSFTPPLRRRSPSPNQQNIPSLLIPEFSGLQS